MILDTSVFISAERRQWNARQLISHLETMLPDEEMRLPATAAAELIHGIFRAKVPQHVTDRSNFVKEILYVLPVITFSETTAWIAGRIRGEQARNGNTPPFADSLIAASALELQDAVITTNVKDFIRIPGLNVIPFSLP